MKRQGGGDYDGETPEFDNRDVFGSGYRLIGIPIILVAFIAALLAWRQGGDTRALGVSALLTTSIVAVAGIARQRNLRLPTSALAGLMLVGIAGSALWAIAYRGIDGGFWVNALMIAIVSGMVLPRLMATIVGAIGATSIVIVAAVSDQLDGIHLPTILLAGAGVLFSAMLVSAYQTDTVDLIKAETTRHFAALKDANLQLTAIIQGLTEGLVTTDSENRVNRWNRVLERLTGISEIEVEGEPIDEALMLIGRQGRMVGADHPCRRARYGPVLEGAAGGDDENEISLATADGRAIPVMISAAPLLSDTKVIGVAAVVLDVTRERELNEARDALVSMVSHELRTPLTMILGFSELLAEGGLSDEDEARCATQIDEAAKRLNLLIEDLLSAAALESGQIELNKRRVQVLGLVNQMTSNLPPEHRARIETAVSGDLVAHCDPDKFGQVMTNLIGNALKYSDSGAPVRVVATGNGGEIIVTVTDSGIGIDPSEADRLFEKFARSDDARVQSAQGTGLGLYITRQLVELHGGTIDVESTPGSGSEFRFTIPAQ